MSVVDKNYSQNEEQIAILEYFARVTPPPNGRRRTFLDLGANDGETLSNTRALALLGYDGVCVDASPRAFERLSDLYRGREGVSVYHFAVGATNGTGVLYESGSHMSPNDVALVSTVKPQETKRFEQSTTYRAVDVPCITWDRFIASSPIKRFDFISMDIEGSELDVLPLMNLDDTRCLCIEWNGKHALKTAYEKYLTGFRLTYASLENLIYVR